MKNDLIVPIILCGGSGTRLWPLSRKSYPKQFLNFNSKNNYSLLQNTVNRVKDKKIFKNPILICNEEHRFIVAEQMRQINIEPAAIILEPFSRNTAPAITLSAFFSIKLEKNSNILILSSDHLINDEKKFIEIINLGSHYSNAGKLVTFGVIPDAPETGYGYIESENTLCNSIPKGENIKRFIEKPNLKDAEKLLKSKSFSWNSGIFLFKAKTFLEEINKFNPSIYICCQKALEDIQFDLDFIRIKKDFYKDCPNISIDYAVMEKTSLGIVFPLDVGWNDIGSWKAVWDTSKKDKEGNVIQGNVIAQEIKNSFLRSDHRLLVVKGMENIMVVETADAILIAKKEDSQDIKNIVELLKEKNFKEAIDHRKVYRPWGHFITIENELGWQIKKIEVKVGESISLQKHHHRSEHWIIIKGTALVEIDDSQKLIFENQSAYIPLGATHRLSNSGDVPLVLIEVQTGEYLSEEDIVRFDDKYGRLE